MSETIEFPTGVERPLPRTPGGSSSAPVVAPSITPSGTQTGSLTTVAAERAVENTRFHRLRVLFLFAVVLASVGVCVGYWYRSLSFESTDDAFVDGHVVEAAPQVGGRVADVLVDDNQLVTAGQVLLQIDPADYQVKLDQATAAAAQARGQLAQAQAQRQVNQAVAQQATAQIAVARANLERASADVRRYDKLQGDAVSQLVRDDAHASCDGAAAQMDAATQSAAAAEAQVDYAETAIATATANVKAADALVAQAKLNVSYCKVVAGIDGYVTRKAVERGNYIQVGQQLMAIVPTNVFITANFKEIQLDRMRVGQRVDLRADAYPEKVFHGHVDSLMRGTGSAFSLLPAENATGNYVKVVQRVPVKILLDPGEDHDHLLSPGMSVVPEVRVK